LGGLAGSGGIADAAGTSLVNSGSASSLSMSSQVGSLISTCGGALSNNELLGAVLLMLTLEYLKNEDGDQRKDILSMLGMLLQQGAAGQSSTMMYSFSSLSIESSTQIVSSSTGLAAYSGLNLPTSQTPAADSPSAGLDVIA
jgi:hypothetical protein